MGENIYESLVSMPSKYKPNANLVKWTMLWPFSRISLLQVPMQALVSVREQSCCNVAPCHRVNCPLFCIFLFGGQNIGALSHSNLCSGSLQVCLRQNIMNLAFQPQSLVTFPRVQQDYLAPPCVSQQQMVWICMLYCYTVLLKKTNVHRTQNYRIKQNLWFCRSKKSEILT